MTATQAPKRLANILPLTITPPDLRSMICTSWPRGKGAPLGSTKTSWWPSVHGQLGTLTSARNWRLQIRTIAPNFLTSQWFNISGRNLTFQFYGWNQPTAQLSRFCWGILRKMAQQICCWTWPIFHVSMNQTSVQYPLQQLHPHWNYWPPTWLYAPTFDQRSF